MNDPLSARTVPELIQHLAKHHGDQVLATGFGRSISYRQAEEESAELALGLLAAGAHKGTRIGLLMPSSPDWIVTWLAGLRIGALVTGISTFLKPRELAWVLRFADIEMLLMADKYLRHDYIHSLEQALPAITDADGASPLVLPDAPYLRRIWTWGETRPAWARGDGCDLIELGRNTPEFDRNFLEHVEAQVTPSDPGVVIFTSGSMTDPKGVVHSQGTVVRHAHVMSPYGNCKAGERVGAMAPFFWIGGMLTTMLNTMIAGGTLICPERLDPEYVLKLIRRENLDYLTGWGGQLNALKEHPEFKPSDFANLRPSHGTQERTGILGPPAKVALNRRPNSLGMSESFGPHSGELPGTILPEDRVGSFGRAIAGVERKIVDPDTLVELPPGEEGELLIRGDTLMLGYYKKERSEAFEPDGFFRTGDRCAITEDGHLFFHGRLGEMIKTSGANVSPAEVELVLMSYPDVLEAVVVGMPDPKIGEKVVALVVPQRGTAPPAEDVLRERLKRELSSYKVPKQIIFVRGEDLPRTDSGKVQKRKLIAALLDSPPPSESMIENVRHS